MQARPPFSTRPPLATDRGAALEMLECCAAFTPGEVGVAIEMLDDGLAGDYTLVGAEAGGVLRGYACTGRAWLTQSSWYLYWICVHPGWHGSGLAQALMRATDDAVHAAGGRRIVLETSARPAYERQRRFYARCGFAEHGRIADFYAPGDDCLICVKTLEARA